MAITEQQKQERRLYIGSSDAPAIVGVDPFRDRMDVYWEKVLETVPEPEHRRFEVGNAMESSVLSWAARKLGVEIQPDVRVIHDDGIRAANLDAIVVGRREAMEAKTTAHTHHWGAEMTAEIPDRVLVQTLHQMAVADLERVWVPVLLGGGMTLELRLYVVERDDAAIDELTAKEMQFWRDHVVAGMPPDLDSVPPLQLLKRRRREAGASVDLDQSARAVVEAYERARLRVREAERERDEAQRLLLDLLGDAECGLLPDGGRVSFAEQCRTTVDTTRLRSEYPAVYAELKRESRFRVLRTPTKKETDDATNALQRL